MASSGCGGNGCNNGGDSDTAGPIGRDCQGPNIPNPKFICPAGYFCKYEDGQDMLHPNELGKCQAMEQYKPCKSIMLCGSSDYTPKCETVNETAYCDWLQSSLRCKCEGPGPFVGGEADGDDLKTPTTGTPAPPTTTATTTK